MTGVDECILENAFLRLTVSTQGAQMKSLYDLKGNRELLWTGDASVWADTAPWLFPLIGRQKNDCYTVQGQQYAMPMHGFAKDMRFSVTQSELGSAVFTLYHTQKTLAMYPWRFTLRIAYRLVGARLCITCSVENHESVNMHFALGAHPGFLCERGDILTTDADTPLTLYRLDMPAHLFKGKPDGQMLPVIHLHEHLFDGDAMIFAKPDAYAVTLKRAAYSVQLSFGSVPFLGVWSRPRGGLRYVCVEPWFGADDRADSDGCIEHKAGIVTLGGGERFDWPLEITLNP